MLCVVCCCCVCTIYDKSTTTIHTNNNTTTTTTNNNNNEKTILQKKTRVRIWLYEDTRMQMEGVIIGFDEYMNVVLDDAVEMTARDGRKEIGRILLKGDAITLLQ